MQQETFTIKRNMKIKILFFGIARDLAQENSVELEVEKNSKIADVLKRLQKQYPKMKNIQEFSIAVNEEYAEIETVIKANDVVAIIPPVSGG